VMKIILIRHASRVRDPNSNDDKDLQLTSDGVSEARELGDKMVSLGLRPTLFLTSCHAHAKQTGEILRDQVAGDHSAPVVAIRSLTPNEPYDFEEIIRESGQNKYDLSKLDLVAFVLHHPRLNQLLERLTSQSVSRGKPDYSEAVCLTADSLGEFLQGKGYEEFRIEAR